MYLLSGLENYILNCYYSLFYYSLFYSLRIFVPVYLINANTGFVMLMDANSTRVTQKTVAMDLLVLEPTNFNSYLLNQDK